jgi:microcystin-dependent protein
MRVVEYGDVITLIDTGNLYDCSVVRCKASLADLSVGSNANDGNNFGMTQRTITLTLTDAGRAALIDGKRDDTDVQFTAIALGSGTIKLDRTATALTHEQERSAIFSSSDLGSDQISLSALFNTDPTTQYNVTELALIANDIVFGVWSTTDVKQALAVRTAGVPYTSTIAVGYAQLPSQNVTVVTQPLDEAVQVLIKDTIGNAITVVFQRLAPVVDVGAVNTYVATNVAPFMADTLVHGVRQRITIKTSNAGPSTYAPDGLPPKPILGMTLQPLRGGELLATLIAELEYIVAPTVNSGEGAWLLLRCGGGNTLQLWPAGFILHWPNATPPEGFLACNGSAIARTIYPELFAVIGTTYGAGDGTTTFNIPDLRGEFIRGFDAGRGVDSGRTLGSAQASQNLEHNHPVTDLEHTHGVNDSGHTHSIGGIVWSQGTNHLNIPKGWDWDWADKGTKSTTGITIQAAKTSISIANSGGTEARPRNIALLPIIKY